MTMVAVWGRMVSIQNEFGTVNKNIISATIVLFVPVRPFSILA